MDVSDDGFVCLLDDDKNETRSDIKLPEGVLGKAINLIKTIEIITHRKYPSFNKGKELKGAFESEETVKVILLKAMGEEHILGFKVDTK